MLSIRLVNEQPHWLAGDWLEGVVMLSVRSPQSARGVRLRLTGVEHTSWTISYTSHSGGRSHTQRRTLNETREVFNKPTDLH